MRSINIDQELISELTGHIREKNHEAALAMLDQFRPEDIADIFWDIDLPEAKYIILAIGKEKAVEVIRSLDAELQGRFFKGYQAREIAEDVIEYLDSDDAVDILNLLSAQKSAEVLSYLSDQQFAKNLVSLLHYDDDIAGGLMAKELIKVRTHWTMIQCVEEIRKQAEEVDVVHVVYAVDADDILLGIVSLKAIVLAKANSTVQDLVNHQFISVNAYATGEEVARLMNKYDLIAIPVVDSMGRLMGRITIDDVVDFIKEEADRDYQLQAGLSENVDSTDKVLVLSRARMPWLLVGLLGGLGSSALVSHFEPDLRHLPQMAFFMPVVAAMGGNAGVQSSAIIVQGLANNTLQSMNILPKLAKEFTVALLNGLICSAILLSWNIFIGHQNFDLSITVSLALITVIIFASVLGTLTPLVLEKFNIDPALATGPFISTTNDIIGLTVYFSLGRLLLGSW